MSLAPGTRLGAYDIVTLLGVGGMGEIYRARDARLGRDVAIKVLAGGRRNRLTRAISQQFKRPCAQQLLA